MRVLGLILAMLLTTGVAAAGVGGQDGVVKSPIEAPPPPPLRPELAPLMAPVVDAIAEETAAQGALPPAASDRERLERMGRLDQAARRNLNQIDVSHLSADDQQAVFRNVWAHIGAVDRANQTALLAMVPAEGWFYRSVWGEQASQAAFLIVQHGTPDMWRRFVPVLGPLVETGEVRGEAYAMMYDRLEMMEGRPQRYGTQMRCVDGRWTLHDLEAPADAVDQRRQSMGIAMPVADYVALFADDPPCG